MGPPLQRLDQLALFLVVALAAGGAAAVWWLPPGLGPWTMVSDRVLVPDGHGTAIGALAFSDDGQRLASAGWDGSLRLWRRVDGLLLARGDGSGPLERLGLEAGSVWGVDGERRLWRWAPGDTRVEAAGDCDEPRRAAWVGELCREESVESALDDRETTGPHGLATSVARSPDGATAVASWDGALRIHSVDWSEEQLLGAPPLTVATPLRGSFLASSHGFGLSGGGEIRLYDGQGTLLRRLRHPGGVAVCLAFSADGRSLMARDRAARFVHWRLPDGVRADGPTPGSPEACPQADPRALSVVIWEQVSDAETLLLDRRTDWSVVLTEGYLRAARRPRSVADRLLGRVPLFALGLDGNLVLARAVPRWPTGATAAAAAFAILGLARLGRRRGTPSGAPPV